LSFANVFKLLIPDRIDDVMVSSSELWCLMQFQQYFRYIVAVSFIGVLGENHQPAASHCQTYHIMLFQVHLAMSRIQIA
jgi:hypothetical protein